MKYFMTFNTVLCLLKILYLFVPIKAERNLKVQTQAWRTFVKDNSLNGRLNISNRVIYFARHFSCKIENDDDFNVCTETVRKADVVYKTYFTNRSISCFDNPNVTKIKIYFPMYLETDYCCGMDLCNKNSILIPITISIFVCVALVLFAVLHISRAKLRRQRQIMDNQTREILLLQKQTQQQQQKDQPLPLQKQLPPLCRSTAVEILQPQLLNASSANVDKSDGS